MLSINPAKIREIKKYFTDLERFFEASFFAVALWGNARCPDTTRGYCMCIIKTHKLCNFLDHSSGIETGPRASQSVPKASAPPVAMFGHAYELDHVQPKT